MWKTRSSREICLRGTKELRKKEKVSELSSKGKTVKSILAVLISALILVLICSLVIVGMLSLFNQYESLSYTSHDAILQNEVATPSKQVEVERTKVTEAYIGDTSVIAYAVKGSNQIVYAYDIISDWSPTGSVYQYTEQADIGLEYILNYGYPNSSITNRSEIDQYITQMAIWVYLADKGKISKVSSALLETDKEACVGIRDEIISLSSKAKWAAQNKKAIMGVGNRNAYVYTNPANPVDRIVVCSYPEEQNSAVRNLAGDDNH